VASGKLTSLAPGVLAEDWSPDGRALLCNDLEGKQLSLLSLDAGSKPHPVLKTGYRKNWFRFSRDGKWVVYSSAEPGRYEIFVASFPDFAIKKQVSSGGGFSPAWQKDGKAVYFRAVDGSMMYAEVRTGSQLEIGLPKPLFKWGFGNMGSHFSITRDSERFLVNELASRSNPSETVIVLNWLAGRTSRE
jgi:Tol biopolymer transport system component